MVSIGVGYRTLGTRARYLQCWSTPTNLQQQFRLATTVAKPKAGRMILPTQESKGTVKKTRFSAKRTLEQSIETAQDTATKIAATPTTTASTNTVPTETSPDTAAAAPQRRRPIPTPVFTEETEAEAGAQPEMISQLDPKSEEYQKAYKAAARKYTALMVSIPVALVTSYFLFKKITPGLGVRPASSKDEQSSNV